MKTEFYVYHYFEEEWVSAGVFKTRPKAMAEARKYDRVKVIQTVSTVIL